MSTSVFQVQLSGGEDQPVRINFAATHPANEPQAKAMQAVADCFVNDLPKRLSEVAPVAATRVKDESADMAALRAKIGKLLGKSKSYNNGVLDALNCLPK